MPEQYACVELLGLLQPVLAQDAWPDGGGGDLITVQNDRVQVDPTRPAHRSRNLVNGYRSEGLVVVDGAEQPVQHSLEVEFSDKSVGEGDAESASAKVADCGDTYTHAHALRLLEGLDGRESSRHLRSRPVAHELRKVFSTPLLYESGGGPGKSSGDDHTVVDPYQGFGARIDCVKVRWVVVREIHVNRNSVELTDAGHVRQGASGVSRNSCRPVAVDPFVFWVYIWRTGRQM